MKNNLYASNERPYLSSKKHKGVVVCPECKLVFINGKWKKAELPNEYTENLCPACRRIKDGYFGGILYLKSDILKTKKEEILKLAKNKESTAQVTNPLRRIGKIEEKNDSEIIIYTTFEHLATSIGKAIRKAYQGELTIQYRENEKAARIYWKK